MRSVIFDTQRLNKYVVALRLLEKLTHYLICIPDYSGQSSHRRIQRI